MRFQINEKIRYLVTNNYTFGGLLFVVIIMGGIFSSPYWDSTTGRTAADDNNRTKPFVIKETEAEEGSKPPEKDGTDEVVVQPASQEGGEVSFHATGSPFVLRRPLLSTLRLLKNFNVRWRNAFKSRHRWIEIQKVERRALK